MRRGEVLAIVQAGGQGSRMDVLTRERAKPALPFGGVHRLVDFALSSLVHSELVDVWVSVQYQVASIDDYLAGGRPWSLDRNRGGFRRMVPQTGTGPSSEEGFASGNADLLLKLQADIAVQGAEHVVVSSADHVFNMELAPVIEQHVITRQRGDPGHRRGHQEGGRGQRRGAHRPGWRRPRHRGEGVAAEHRHGRDRDLRLPHRAVARGAAAAAGRARRRRGGRRHRGRRLRRAPAPAPDRDRERCTPYRSTATGATSASRTPTSRATATCSPGRSTSSTTRTGRSSPTGPTGPPRGCARAPGAPTACSHRGATWPGRCVGSVLGPGVVVERGARATDSVLFDDVVIRSGAVVQTAIVDERSEVRRTRGGRRGADAPGSPATRTWCWSGRDCVVDVAPRPPAPGWSPAPPPDRLALARRWRRAGGGGRRGSRTPPGRPAIPIAVIA